MALLPPSRVNRQSLGPSRNDLARRVEEFDARIAGRMRALLPDDLLDVIALPLGAKIARHDQALAEPHLAREQVDIRLQQLQEPRVVALRLEPSFARAERYQA